MNTENFKDIPGYEGLYQAGDMGNIKAMKKTWRSGIHGCIVKIKEEHILKQSNIKKYKVVSLLNDGFEKSIKVHRLVCMTFHENKNDKPEINHIDGNTHNNTANNLEWCTRKENAEHASKNGLMKFHRGEDHYNYGNKGALNPLSKIILDTETGIFYIGTKEAADIKNIRRTTLINMLSGHDRNHTSLTYV